MRSAAGSLTHADPLATARSLPTRLTFLPVGKPRGFCDPVTSIVAVSTRVRWPSEGSHTRTARGATVMSSPLIPVTTLAPVVPSVFGSGVALDRQLDACGPAGG